MARGLFPGIGAFALLASASLYLFLRQKQRDAKVNVPPDLDNLPASVGWGRSSTANVDQAISVSKRNQTPADAIWREAVAIPFEWSIASRGWVFLGPALALAILAQGIIVLIPPQLQLPRFIVDATQPIDRLAPRLITAVNARLQTISPPQLDSSTFDTQRAFAVAGNGTVYLANIGAKHLVELDPRGRLNRSIGISHSDVDSAMTRSRRRMDRRHFG